MPVSQRFVLATVLLLFLLQSLLRVSASIIDNEEDDLEGLEELLAVDQEEDQEKGAGGGIQNKLSEAEILRRAQKIVVELSNENAEKVVLSNAAVLLLGYAPWCPRSAELMPKFAEAATALREMGSNLVVAKLDAERHEKAAKLLGIKGFPTILLFIDGSPLAYRGGFTKEEIVIWVKKKTGAPVIRLSSLDAAEEFLRWHQIFIMGYFENYEGPEYDEFLKAAITDNEIQFVETIDSTIARLLFPDVELDKKFIGLVKSEPERFEKFDDNFEEHRILQFIEYNKFPLVTELTELNSARVYSSAIKLQVFIFSTPEDFDGLRPLIQDVAKSYKRNIMFIYVDNAQDNLAKPFMTLYGLESEEPIVTAFDNRIGSKYLLEADLAQSTLEEFCNRFLHGTLLPYFKSEPIPSEKAMVEKVVGKTFSASVLESVESVFLEKAMVEKVVGKTFSASVLESVESVFLEVYTPWCMDCDATSKQVQKLAEHFKGLEDLKFARIDASLNEHPKLEINNYPTLLLYPAGDKSKPIKVSKKSSLKDFIAFVKKHAKADEDRGILDEKEEKKQEL